MSEQRSAENDVLRDPETGALPKDGDWPCQRWDKTEPDPNDENARHHRRGHVLELRECDWRCLICGHWFDAASDADLFWCGNRCKHPGDTAPIPPESPHP